MDTLAIVALILLGVYLLDCAVFPKVKHWMCGGSGKLRSPLSKAERPCRCDGGRVVRLGARLMGRG